MTPGILILIGVFGGAMNGALIGFVIGFLIARKIYRWNDLDRVDS